MPEEIAYPFTPKSVSRLRPGQFFGFVLSNGTCAAGQVLTVPVHQDGDPGGHLLRSQRSFVYGLLDWNGPSLPQADDLEGAAIVRWGEAHIKAITEHPPGMILGSRALLTTDGAPAARMKSHTAGGVVWVYKWGHCEGPASREDKGILETMGSWGYGVGRALAERLFIGGSRS